MGVDDLLGVNALLAGVDELEEVLILDTGSVLAGAVVARPMLG